MPGVEAPDVLSGAAMMVRVPELVIPPPLNEKSTVLTEATTKTIGLGFPLADHFIETATMDVSRSTTFSDAVGRIWTA